MSPVTGVLIIIFLCSTVVYSNDSKKPSSAGDKEKAGSCPVPPERCFKAPRLNGICTKDHQCPGDLKCCVQTCEYACIRPAKLEKSGQCPHVEPPNTVIGIRCISVNTTACVNDVDCEGNQKCCSEFCVNKCRDPMAEPTVEKSGQCHRVGLPNTVIRFACPSVNTTACVNDVDCKGDQKCCREFCSNKCRDPIEKAGSCPVQAMLCKKAPRLDGICTKDHQCPGDLKCCVQTCEYACIEPVRPKKIGQCPHVGPPHTVIGISCISLNTTACVNDVDCDGNQKCCSEFCVNKCRDPMGEPTLVKKSGQCPHVGPLHAVIRFKCPAVNKTACENDADCEGCQKCCSEFCVNKCRDPKFGLVKPKLVLPEA